MERKSLAQHIQEQVKEWEGRVFYPNVKFKENTPADLKLLERELVRSNNEGSILLVASETPGCVYKIGRFFVEKGVKNKNITFLEGDVLMPYIETEAKYRWQARNLIDELVDNIGKEIAYKWVIIPEMNFEWDKELVLYFMSKIEKVKPMGILFYCNKNCDSNFAQILIEETYHRVLQFPKPRYTPKKDAPLAEDDY